ncbi:MAG: ribulose 1,5-bisphosphate carboxylase large subunit [Spirochaetes bacterium]|nr:MAG: ribulose 1,5-bisphosphate carboxylase large subunit [Spirochaetota bacterium]
MIRELVEFQSPPGLSSGERFRVIYRLEGSEDEALARARDICLEQTVEFPDDLIPEGFIRDSVLGRIESFGKGAHGSFEAVIGFPVETAAGELTQLLNVVFGNISIKPGIFVQALDLSASLYARFTGPRFGIAGLRRVLGAENRPLLSTALKPMGLTARGLASLAGRFALGGIDLIKDDHGLTDQPFAPFEERVARCAQAVMDANRETGMRCLYAPNVTAPAHLVVARARYAKEAGAGALLVAPGITGPDAMRLLAAENDIGLPILAHPALQGSFVMGGNGISHYCIFGQLARLAGADASIFPNFGGRFSFSRDECGSIARGCREPMGPLAPIFPSPGGGMTLENVPEMREFYGNDVVYLMGGGLFRHSDDLAENCRHFRKLVGG